MSETKYYAPMTDLVPVKDLPESLGFIRSGLVDLFSHLFYENLKYAGSPSGDYANIRLNLVLPRKIALEIPASGGLALVLNPDHDDSAVSSFPIHFEYHWPIVGWVDEFDPDTFLEGPKAWFELFTQISGLELSELLKRVIEVFLPDEDGLEEFVEDFTHTALTLTEDPDVDAYLDLVEQIEAASLDVITVLVDDFITKVSDPAEQLLRVKEVFLVWLGDFSWDNIKELITPYVAASINDIRLGLEFPRTWLIPIDEDGERIEDEDVKAMLSFDIGSLRYSTTEGLDFQKALEFNFQPAEILGTGLILEVTNLELDLSETTNIAAATADERDVAFKGVSIESASITLPASWKKNEDEGAARIVASDLVIGTEGGFTGKLSLDTTDSSILAFDLPGDATLRLDSFSIEFAKNSVEAVDIAGSLTIPGLEADTGDDAEISIEIGYAEGIYEISADTSGDGISLKHAGTELTLKAFSLSFDKNGIVSSAISGQLEIEKLKDAEGNRAEVDFTLEINNQGFIIRASEPEGAVLSLKNALDITIYELEIGYQDKVGYFRTHTDFDLTLDAPVIGKYIPDQIDINSLYLDTAGTVKDIDITAEWSDMEGMELRASDAGVSLRVPTNATLFEILTVSAVEIGLYKAEAGGVDLEVLLSGSLELGPVTGAVSDTGVRAHLDYDAGGGNLGPMEVSAQFVPPEGIGITIDAKVVKGGGYIRYEEENHRYTGTLELSIKEVISVKAVAILDLRDADGNSTFSLLVAISAEFKPIQLGYGFTLNGVGGILGTNRTMLTDVIREGLKDGILESLLFPKVDTSNIDKLVTDLQSVFPIEQSQYVFGPFGKIGYGTPTLLTLDLGLLLELANPVRLAIVGVLGVQLPTEEFTLVQIRVGFIGEIDFEKKMLAFDASLFDSYVLNWTLSGDMALRLTWGENPNFLLTVGGFHPDYEPPALSLPEINRLTINLLSGDEPRLTLSAYFALTSNSVQFGASIEFYTKVTKNIYVEGFLGFDAIFQFSPFWFKIAVGASLAVMRKNVALLGIYVGGSLEGPTPWRAQGVAEFKVLGIKCKVKFDKTFGKRDSTTFSDVDVTSKLVEAVTNSKNWLVEPESEHGALVSYAEVAALKEEIVVDPNGQISISQKIVPLDTKIDVFGNQKPKESDPEWNLELYAGTTELSTKAVQEHFAPAQFFEKSDKQKVSGKSFEKMPAGVKASAGSELEGEHFLEREVTYDQKILDETKVSGGMYTLDKTFFGGLLARNSTSRSDLGKQSKFGSILGPDKVKPLTADEFHIVSTADLSRYGTFSAHTAIEAEKALANILAANPLLKNELQVMPATEIASL